MNPIPTAVHTPTPWSAHSDIGCKGELGIVADAAPCIIAIMGNQKAWPVEAASNAAFIVRACNSHAALVAALEGLVNCPDYRGISTHEMHAARIALQTTGQ